MFRSNANRRDKMRQYDGIAVVTESREAPTADGWRVCSCDARALTPAWSQATLQTGPSIYKTSGQTRCARQDAALHWRRFESGHTPFGGIL